MVTTEKGKGRAEAYGGAVERLGSSDGGGSDAVWPLRLAVEATESGQRWRDPAAPSLIRVGSTGEWRKKLRGAGEKRKKEERH